MAKEQARSSQERSEDINGNRSLLPGSTNEDTKEIIEQVLGNNNDISQSDQQNDDEVTNNDGSIVETLDIAFHNKTGVIKDNSVAGSNRADYYEARSQGETDAEEEQDFIKKQQQK